METHIHIRNLSHHWFRYWLFANTAPSHYLNQCWNIVNWTLRNRLIWKLNRNWYILNSRKCIWKCRLENGGHFVSASMCFNSARHGDAYTHQWTGSSLLQLRVNNRCHQCRLFVKIIMRNKYQWNLNQRMGTNFQKCSQLKWILENFGQCIYASLYKMRPVVGHYKRNLILFLYMPITIL